jgi:uncharacterized OB-fold protein
LSGRATVFTYTVVHRAFDPEFADEVPYIGALVTPDEDEDVRFVTRLIKVSPAEVRVGMSVFVEFVPDGNGGALPLFAPVLP